MAYLPSNTLWIYATLDQERISFSYSVKRVFKTRGVLEAMGRIERHRFIPDSALHNHAYEDKAFPIGDGQTISQPYTVAFQTEKLEIEANEKVLEIGTGSGYQAAVLAELGARVYTIERFRTLYDKNESFAPIHEVYNDSHLLWRWFLGKPIYAPFDKCIVTLLRRMFHRP